MNVASLLLRLLPHGADMENEQYFDIVLRPMEPKGENADQGNLFYTKKDQNCECEHRESIV